MLFLLFGEMLGFGFILLRARWNFFLMGILLLILLITASFSSLKAIVSKDYLQIKFGGVIFQKKFLLREIVSAKTVRNHWYYGWGIRYVPSLLLKPPVWIYNVSGFDAVEIVMKDGKVYRIGTDEPEKLQKVLQKAI